MTRLSAGGVRAALVLVLGVLAICAPAASAQCLFFCDEGSPPPAPAPAPVPTPSSPPPPIQFGFNDMVGMKSLSETQFASMAADAGAKLHRWAVSWQNWEPRNNEFAGGYMHHLGHTYEADQAAGVGSVVLIFGSPRWAIDPLAKTPAGGRPCKVATDSCLAPPNLRNRSIRADFKRFVQTLARNFPDAAGFEVWNEPNLQWAWEIEQDPELYAMMVSVTKNALREIGSPIPVLTGGLSNTRTTNARYTSLENMLSAIYDTAGRDNFDAISFHSYPCANRQPSASMQSTLERVRRVKGARNDLDRPLWITESGASTAGDATDGCGLGYTDSSQRSALRSVIDWGAATQQQAGDVPVLILHSLLNPSARSELTTPHEEGRLEYGIVAWSMDEAGAASFLEKPAYAAVRCGFLRTC